MIRRHPRSTRTETLFPYSTICGSRYRAKAAMIIAMKAMADKEETTFNKSFGVARFFYWRAFGISLLIRLAMGLLFVILFTPISYLSRSEEHKSELQSLMRISYADLCLKKKMTITDIIIYKDK